MERRYQLKRVGQLMVRFDMIRQNVILQKEKFENVEMLRDIAAEIADVTLTGGEEATFYHDWAKRQISYLDEILPCLEVLENLDADIEWYSAKVQFHADNPEEDIDVCGLQAILKFIGTKADEKIPDRYFEQRIKVREWVAQQLDLLDKLKTYM